MKRYSLKIVIIILLIGFLMPLLNIIYNNRVEAASFNPNPYVNDLSRDSTTETGEISKIGKIIIGMIRGVGTVVSVIALIAIGIKYMAGSVEEKATYKQTLLPYIIGAVMLFGITNILPIIVTIANAI